MRHATADEMLSFLPDLLDRLDKQELFKLMSSCLYEPADESECVACAAFKTYQRRYEGKPDRGGRL